MDRMAELNVWIHRFHQQYDEGDFNYFGLGFDEEDGFGDFEYEFVGPARIIGKNRSHTADLSCLNVRSQRHPITYGFNINLGEPLPLLVSSNLEMAFCYAGSFTIVEPTSAPTEDYTHFPFYNDTTLAVVSKKGTDEFSGYFYSDQPDWDLTLQTFYLDSGPHKSFRIKALLHH